MHEHTSKRVAAVIALVDDLGLQPPPPTDPLPEIHEQDVDLVISHDYTLTAVGPPHEGTAGAIRPSARGLQRLT
jgi:hypothetical protein